MKHVINEARNSLIFVLNFSLDLYKIEIRFKLLFSGKMHHYFVITAKKEREKNSLLYSSHQYFLLRNCTTTETYNDNKIVLFFLNIHQ